MMIKKTNRKYYEKPKLSQIKLEIKEAILANCKLNADDNTGKGNKGCASSGCKGNIFGS
jgi:hypothetical protein